MNYEYAIEFLFQIGSIRSLEQNARSEKFDSSFYSRLVRLEVGADGSSQGPDLGFYSRLVRLEAQAM